MWHLRELFDTAETIASTRDIRSMGEINCEIELPVGTQPAVIHSLILGRSRLNIRQAIKMALKNISMEQIWHPDLGFQERVVCCELYYQLRVLEEKRRVSFRPARLQAELNKTAQHRFRKFFGERLPLRADPPDWSVSEAMPDLLIHQPGCDKANRCVVEAKLVSTSDIKIRWDLAKLTLFSQGKLRYERRVLLLISDQLRSPKEVLDRIQKFGITHGDVRIDVAAYLPDPFAVSWASLRRSGGDLSPSCGEGPLCGRRTAKSKEKRRRPRAGFTN
jgi:hypothetical protein